MRCIAEYAIVKDGKDGVWTDYDTQKMDRLMIGGSKGIALDVTRTSGARIADRAYKNRDSAPGLVRRSRCGRVPGETTKTIDDFILQINSVELPVELLTLDRMRAQKTKTKDRYRIMVYLNCFAFHFPNTYLIDSVDDARNECLRIVNNCIAERNKKMIAA